MDLRWKRNSFQYSGLILNTATFIPKSLFFNGSHCEWQRWAEAKPTLDGATWAAQLLCALVVLLGLAFYNLVAQEVKMRDSADFCFFFFLQIFL